MDKVINDGDVINKVWGRVRGDVYSEVGDAIGVRASATGGLEWGDGACWGC